MSHIHDPNSELRHIAEELLQDNEEKEKIILKESKKNIKISTKMGFAYGVIGASLLSAFIIASATVYTHYKDIKIKEHEFDIEMLEKKINEQKAVQEKINVAITRLRLIFEKARRYCKKNLPQKMDELEDSKLDAMALLIELHSDAERLFNQNVLNEIDHLLDKEYKRPLCTDSSNRQEIRMEHVKIYNATQRVIANNISLLAEKIKKK